MDDILGLAKPKADGSARRIKELVRMRFGLGDDATLMVSELRCHKDGCPDIETVVAVMGDGGDGADKMTWKIAKPMTEVSPADVAALSVSA